MIVIWSLPTHRKLLFSLRRWIWGREKSLCTGFALSNEANRVPSLSIGSRLSALLQM